MNTHNILIRHVGNTTSLLQIEKLMDKGKQLVHSHTKSKTKNLDVTLRPPDSQLSVYSSRSYWFFISATHVKVFPNVRVPLVTNPCLDQPSICTGLFNS